jgi:hypothetical protein
MFRKLAVLTAFVSGVLASVVPSTCLAQTGKGSDNLAGAWRGQVRPNHSLNPDASPAALHADWRA